MSAYETRRQLLFVFAVEKQSLVDVVLSISSKRFLFLLLLMMSLSRRAAAAGILHVLKSYFEQKSAEKKWRKGVAKRAKHATEREIRTNTHEKKSSHFERLNHNSEITNIDA